MKDRIVMIGLLLGGQTDHYPPDKNRVLLVRNTQRMDFAWVSDSISRAVLPHPDVDH
jgi:hypothetical protein